MPHISHVRRISIFYDTNVESSERRHEGYKLSAEKNRSSDGT